MKVPVFFAALMLALGVGRSAEGTSLTFESVTSTFYPLGTSVTDSGYRLTNVAGDMYGLLGHGCTPSCAFNGTQRMLAYDSTAPALLLTKDDGAPFALYQFDLGESFSTIPSIWAKSLSVEGTLAAGGTIVAVFGLDGVNDGSGPLVDYQTQVLPAGFSGLSAVKFVGLGGDVKSEFTLDNLVVATPVPEPSSLLLVAIGVAINRYRCSWRRAPSRTRRDFA